jgi:TolA-binding protein
MLRQTEERYPDSEFAPRAALRTAELLRSLENEETALREYERIAAKYAQTLTQASALHQQGLILFGLNRFDAALEFFRILSDTFPDAPETPQAYYMQGFCLYLQGNIKESLIICRTFIEKHPDSAWTPKVLFWLGEHAYNRGDYPEAHSTFLNVVNRFPENDLADDAIYWAGNAQFKSDNYLEAFELYGRLVTDHPDSALLPETRFAQGEVLTKLGEFPRAILAYEELVQSAPEAPIADRARGRLGDCLFTLGSTEALRYTEAKEIFLALSQRPSLPFELQLQALYKMARCEEKTGAEDSALAHYMDVIYQAGSQTTPLSPDAILWFTRAALDAAANQERKGLWPQAVHIYERIIEAGVPAQNEAAKRIEQIKLEHADAFRTGDES